MPACPLPGCSQSTQSGTGCGNEGGALELGRCPACMASPPCIAAGPLACLLGWPVWLSQCETRAGSKGRSTQACTSHGSAKPPTIISPCRIASCLLSLLLPCWYLISITACQSKAHRFIDDESKPLSPPTTPASNKLAFQTCYHSNYKAFFFLLGCLGRFFAYFLAEYLNRTVKSAPWQ